jgi:hypothetical protein
MLGDLILEDPKTLSYLANNTRYDGEVKAGAQLLCEYAKSVAQLRKKTSRGESLSEKKEV